MNPLLAQSLDQLMQEGYRVFIDRVAAGRNMAADDVERIADGRVWAGQDALAVGLVDKLGDRRDAIAAAAQRAGLDQYRVELIQPPLTRRERLLRVVGDLVMTAWRGVREPLLAPELVWLKTQVALPEQELLRLKDPGGLYAYCLGCGSL
jgi:protease-4